MRKKILAFGLAAALALTSVSFPFGGTVESSAKEMAENDFTYAVKDSASGQSACVINYSGQEEKVTVPETLGGLPVTEIAFNGSQNRDKITEIHLPKSMKATESSYSSLYYLNRLSSITVADANPELTARDGVLFTKDFSVLAVYPKGKTDERYTEPNTVKKSYGFVGNPYLKEITFSSNKEYTATSRCGYTNIEKAIIPANIKEIGEASFEYCKNLKEIQWGGSETKIGLHAFDNCTALAEVKVPDSVKELGSWAFASCKALKSVQLPFGLTAIGRYAFSSDVSLKNITIPDSVLKIDMGAFNHCSTKIKKAPYLKKITHKYQGGEVSYSYLAKAKVKKNGKVKNYSAGDITKIRPAKKSVKVKKGKKITLKTLVYIKGKKRGALDSSILTFKSGSKAVAKINKKGVVTGKKKGKAKVWITLRTTGKRYKVKVRVVA